MKLLLDKSLSDTSVMGRMQRLTHQILLRIGAKRPGPASSRDAYEAALDSRSITPDQRRAAATHAAANPAIAAGLDRAENARDEWLKAQEAAELHSPTGSGSPSRR